MRTFDYSKMPEELFTPEIINLISKIHEYKGKQDLYIASKPDILEFMVKIAKIQSTGASNRIEGIFTSEARLDALMKETTEPKNRSEQEIAGYREVLKMIHESYDFMKPSTNLILQLHRDLYQFSPSGYGGRYKATDNTIEEEDSRGQMRIRFQPVSSFETPESMAELFSALEQAEKKERIDSLVLTPMFILDFLCIHPFTDGNGRMSRLLTLMLLYRSGYIVGKYVSVEMIIEKTKETYYEVLQDSSQGWHEASNTYLPFVKYYLEIILRAYKDFSERVELAWDENLSKSDRIRNLFEHSLEKWSKKKIQALYPDISIAMIELTLRALLSEGSIIKIGAARSTAYIRNTDK